MQRLQWFKGIFKSVCIFFSVEHKRCHFEHFCLFVFVQTMKVNEVQCCVDLNVLQNILLEMKLDRGRVNDDRNFIFALTIPLNSWGVFNSRNKNHTVQTHLNIKRALKKNRLMSDKKHRLLLMVSYDFKTLPFSFICITYHHNMLHCRLY